MYLLHIHRTSYIVVLYFINIDLNKQKNYIHRHSSELLFKNTHKHTFLHLSSFTAIRRRRQSYRAEVMESKYQNIWLVQT